jgi:hypothetical protein
MTDSVDEILRLVASGHLTAEEAGPVLDALAAYEGGGEGEQSAAANPGSAQALRVQISEGGRDVVNLRIPLSLGRMAIDHVPGLPADMVGRIRAAIAEGLTGPILVVDEGHDGDGIRIVIE